jgi:hypothetical protein
MVNSKNDSGKTLNNVQLDFQYNIEFLENPENETNLEIKQHQICLNCQENGAKWSKNIKYYRTIELLLYIFGFVTTLVSIGFTTWLLFFSEYKSIIIIIKYLDSIKLISANYLGVYIIVTFPVFCFLIEIISILLDLVKLILISIIFNIFATTNPKPLTLNKNRKKYKIEKIKETDEEEDVPIFYPDQFINETIDRLKTRINIRKKFKSVIKSIKLLEIFINIYFIIIIFLSKLVVAILIYLTTFTQYLNLDSLSSNVTKLLNLNQINLLNNNTTPVYSYNDSYIDIDSNKNKTFQLTDSFQCCHKRKLFSEVLSSNYSELKQNECYSWNLDFECFNNLNLSFIIVVMVYLILSSFIKFLLQIILFINFKRNLIKNIINKSYKDELNYSNTYEKCRQSLIRIKANQNREQNEKILADTITSSIYSKQIRKLLDNVNINKQEDNLIQNKCNDLIGSLNENEINDAINKLDQVNNIFINNENNEKSLHSTFIKKKNFNIN